jgi:hypothetical protein
MIETCSKVEPDSPPKFQSILCLFWKPFSHLCSHKTYYNKRGIEGCSMIKTASATGPSSLPKCQSILTCSVNNWVISSVIQNPTIKGLFC